MYKLLLAEDEVAAREGILTGMPWEKLGIGEVKTAKNGVLALETAGEFKPDILLTDIKMPRMNGIKLSEAVRKINPECSILILSGYPEVDYLKSAISLQVVDFVEKPVQLNVLETRIRNAVAVQNQIREKVRLQKMELASALSRPFCPAEQIGLSVRALFSLPPSEEIFVTVRFLRVLTEEYANIPEPDLPAYRQKIEELLCGEAATVGLCDRLIQVTEFGTENLPEEGKSVWENIRKLFPKSVVFMGTGETAPLDNYEHSFSSAADAVAMMFYDRSRFLWNSRDLPHGQAPFDPEIQQYQRLLGDGKQEELKEFVCRLTERAGAAKLPPREVSGFCFRMLSALSHRNSEETPPVQADSADELLWECVFLDRMKDWMEKEIDSCFQSICRYNSSNTLTSVLVFVNQNYHQKDLSLKMLSRRFYLSEAYLCIKFKEETGKTFIQYLTELRIEKSLSMLADKDHKINDIAVSVGFDNGNYFSKIFKKQKGISPKNFRQRFGIT